MPTWTKILLSGAVAFGTTFGAISTTIPSGTQKATLVGVLAASAAALNAIANLFVQSPTATAKDITKQG